MLSREQMIDMAVAFFEEAYIATGLLPHRGSWLGKLRQWTCCLRGRRGVLQHQGRQ